MSTRCAGDQPQTFGHHRGLRPVDHAEGAEDCSHVRFHRAFHDAELARDLLVALAFANQREHLHLPQ